MLFRINILLFSVFVVSSVYPVRVHNPAHGDVIVQLFQWPWNDVARLCPILAENGGFGAVQVSPTQPHRIINHPPDNRGVKRPWWETYQPTAFRIGNTRGGTREEFEAMVKTCNESNIDVYVEVILNHLTPTNAGTGRDSDGKWFETTKDGRLRAGNQADVVTSEFVTSVPCVGTLPHMVLDMDTEMDMDIEPREPLDNCSPVLPYSSSSTSWFHKLNLTDNETKNQVRNFLKELVHAGVKGVSVISSGFTSAKDFESLFEDDADLEDLFVYLEYRNVEQPKPVGCSTDVISHVRLEIPSIISREVLHGIEGSNAEVPADDLSTLFGTLIAGTFLSCPRTVGAIEHHEQIYGNVDASPNMNYSVIKPTGELRDIATALLLLAPKSYAIPRLVWSYSISNAWEGPTSTSPELDIAVVPDRANSWQEDFKLSWLKKLLNLRNRRFVKDPDAEDFASSGSIQSTYGPVTFNSTSMGEFNPINAVVFVLGGGLLKDPETDPETTPLRSETCPVIIALVASHFTNKSDDHVNDVLVSGVYKAMLYDSFIISGAENVPPENIISDAPTLPTVALSVQDISDGEPELSITLTVADSQNLPKFVILDLLATGEGACGAPVDFKLVE